MKKFILSLIIIISLSSNAQKRNDEYFNFVVLFDPAPTFGLAEVNGIDITTELELVEKYFYVKGVVQLFPQIDYVDYGGGVGLNLYTNWYKDIRVYSGIKLGFQNRGLFKVYDNMESHVYPMAGVELGGDYNINERFLVRVKGTYITREDQLFWNADTKAIPEASIGFGYTF